MRLQISINNHTCILVTLYHRVLLTMRITLHYHYCICNWPVFVTSCCTESSSCYTETKLMLDSYTKDAAFIAALAAKSQTLLCAALLFHGVTAFQGCQQGKL